jgi:protocatechuate 3,4-dioxygenase beta subunit
MARSTGIAISMAVVLASLAAGDAHARGTPPAKPPPGPTIAGTVKDESGKPLAGAEAVAAHASAKGTWKATSDARGAFTLRGVPAGEATVVVRARSRVPFEAKVVVPAAGSVACEATLALGVRFAGKATDMRGAAGPGAVVEAVPTADDGVRVVFSATAADPTRSAADGSFVVDGLAAGGRYTLRVRHPRHAPVELPGLPAEAGSGHDALDVVMEDAAWVRGVVVDAAGKPVPTARVNVGGETGGLDVPPWIRSMLEGRGFFFAVSGAGSDGRPVDAQGRFEVGSLVEDEVEISAIADGYFRTRWTVAGLEAGKGKEDVRIALEVATAWIEGRVVDGEGKGLGGIVVSARGDEGDAGEAKTDAIGKFRLARVRSRSPVTLSAEAEGRAPARMTQVALNSGGVTLTLHRAPRLRARIVDAAGKPVAKVLLGIRTQVAENRTDFHSTWVDQGAKGIDVPLPIGEVSVEASTEGGLRGSVGSWTTVPAGVVEAGTVTLARRAPAPEPEPEDEDDDEEE